MELLGHIENGAVVLESSAPLPDGTPVSVDAVNQTEWDYRNGPPPNETPEEWITRLDAWIATKPVRHIVFDDDRASIYDRSCE